MQKFGGLTISKCNNCYHNKVCINGANYKTTESCKHYVSAADVQEVKHGRWISEHISYGVTRYKCSVCGGRFGIIEDFQPNKFCPDCGARMDGKDGEEE